jgi:hypothetical protein
MKTLKRAFALLVCLAGFHTAAVCVALVATVMESTAAPVAVEWDAPTAGDPPQKYMIFERLPDGTTKALATVDAPTTTATLDLGPGEHRLFAVSWNVTGQSEPSNTLFIPGQLPGAPLNFRIRVTAEITVTVPPMAPPPPQ